MCIGMANGGKQIADNGKKALTDEDIIKFLNEADGLEHISICCMPDKGEYIAFVSVTDIVDIINRQQEKIEYMQGEREALLEDIQVSSNQVIEQQAEIEKLTINMNAFGLGMKREKERADTIKAETIKEFADKLKEKIGDSHFQNYGLAILEIHDLVKEMVGDDK